jgi:hypothetical protein
MKSRTKTENQDMSSAESKTYAIYFAPKRNIQLKLLTELARTKGVSSANAHGKQHVVNTPTGLLMMIFDDYIRSIPDPEFHRRVEEIMGERHVGDDELESGELLELGDGTSSSISTTL